LAARAVDRPSLPAALRILLVDSGLIRRRRDGVRILGKGEITSKGLTIEVTGASKSAVAAVESAGGTLKVTKPAAETAEEAPAERSEEHTSELQSRENLVCR